MTFRNGTDWLPIPPVLSPLLGYLTLRCRSVWPAVCLHYPNNLGYFLRA